MPTIVILRPQCSPYLIYLFHLYMKRVRNRNEYEKNRESIFNTCGGKKNDKTQTLSLNVLHTH